MTRAGGRVETAISARSDAGMVDAQTQGVLVDTAAFVTILALYFLYDWSV